MFTCEDCGDSDDWFDEDSIHDEDALPLPPAPEQAHHSAIAGFILGLMAFKLPFRRLSRLLGEE